MTLYKSERTGEIGNREYWDGELNKFWKEIKLATGSTKRKCPRPEDAWDRFVKVLCLEEINYDTNYIPI